MENEVAVSEEERQQRREQRIKEAQESGLTYERLFELAYKMHLKLFNISSSAGLDEKEIYDSIGLTDEENALFGYQLLDKEIDFESLPEDVQEHIKTLIEDIKTNEANNISDVVETSIYE